MHDDVIKIYVGYDPIESVAWHTMVHSIMTRSSKPVAIVPLNLTNLSNIFKRDRDVKQSNEFSFTRFLIPYLNNYKGLAIFFDCDMLIRVDISEILNEVHRNPGKAVYVVKHDYEPKNEIKYLNNIQYKYPRKNWSSVVIWDCSHSSNAQITPDFVNNATAMELHRFLWLKDYEIGELDLKWNWLIGEYDNPPHDVKNIHWTIGGPYFNEYKDADCSEQWFQEFEKMIFCKQKDET